MPELALIPCSDSKNTAPPGLRATVPKRAPNVMGQLTPPIRSAVTALRRQLFPLAGTVPNAFAPAYEMYRGKYARQYNEFPLQNWSVRANPNHHILIISGLYGLLSPYSFIQSYNLSMASALPGVAKRKVMDVWKQNNLLHRALANYCSLHGITVIHDLLTSNYRSAVELHVPINGVWIVQPVQDPRGHKRGKWLGQFL